MATILLRSSDGEIFEATEKVIKCSGTIKNMVDIGSDGNITLKVKSNVLRKFLEWAKHHIDDPDSDEYKKKRFEDLPTWDINFFKLDQQTLHELIIAAHYLDVKPLLDMSCKAATLAIKDENPEEIRKLFEIIQDFAPTDEEMIRKGNEFLRGAHRRV